MSTDPVEQLDGVVVIRTAPLLAATYRAVLHAIARRRLDGVPSHDLQALAKALRRAHIDATSPPRHELPNVSDIPPCSSCENDNDLISVHEASLLLGVSRRTVERMAADHWGGLGAIRIGRTWVLRRSAVLTRAAERREHDRTGRR